MSTAPERSLRRVRARVDGTVQGVGYRPFVYRLAAELDIAGWVLNDERGVLVEAEGPPDVVEAFVARLRSEAPPLAEVRGVEARGRARQRRAGLSDRRQRARRRGDARPSRPTPRRARTASPSSPTPPTGATAIRS